MLLDDFDDIEEEEERSEMKDNGRRRKRRGSYVMPSDFALANDDGSENKKSDDVRFYVSETKTTKTHTYKMNQCVASMLENLFHESSSDNEEEEEEIFNDENNRDKENDSEKENVVFNKEKYPGHARAKSLIERFNKRKEVRPKVIQTNHSKDTEFNDVREYVRNLTGGNIEENERKRMGTIASELIESTGTSY